MTWSPWQKIAFRFFTAYTVLFCLSNQFVTTFLIDPLWQKIVPWFGKHLLGIDITTFTNGSGDTTYNYASIAAYLSLSLLIMVIWSAVDWRRPHYQELFKWLLVLIRYYIIYQMVIYGLAKVFYLQFRPPSYTRLIETFGESSPMGLLWTFMGFSKGYTIFTGTAELLGGLLLLYRPARTLGALVTFGVMVNVMLMNYFYDVPVKLLSTHLVLLSGFLLALDGQRLWDFFIANRAVNPRDILPLFGNPKWERIKEIVKWAVAGVGLIGGAIGILIMGRQLNMNAKPALEGLYEVVAFERNGQEIPPLITDSTRWHRLIVEGQERAGVQLMTDRRLSYSFKVDTIAHQILLRPMAEDTVPYDTFRYIIPLAGQLEIAGRLESDSIRVVFHRKAIQDFPLMSRGYRWINETPYNR